MSPCNARSIENLSLKSPTLQMLGGLVIQLTPRTFCISCLAISASLAATSLPRKKFRCWTGTLMTILLFGGTRQERQMMSSITDRQDLLARTRNLKMAQSSHRYVRGSTSKFYEWLESADAKIPAGPAIWICGDCHIGNLGPLADAKGRVAIQIRDLDQTVIGNPVHDLIRLGLSLASAARSSDLPGVTTAKILEELIAGYQAALAGDFDAPRDRSHRPKQIQQILNQSVRRRWRHLAEERIEDVEPRIPLGRRFWALTKQEQAGIKGLFAEADTRKLLTHLKGRNDEDAVKLVDAAYWVKGCSSLGRLRFAALVRIGSGSSAKFCLVDLKEAVSAAAPRNKRAKMPRDNAERVVPGPRRCRQISASACWQRGCSIGPSSCEN